MDLTHNFSPLLSFEYKYYPIDCIVIILRVQSEFIDMDLWHESLDLIDWFQKSSVSVYSGREQVQYIEMRKEMGQPGQRLVTASM